MSIEIPTQNPGFLPFSWRHMADSPSAMVPPPPLPRHQLAALLGRATHREAVRRSRSRPGETQPVVRSIQNRE